MKIGRCLKRDILLGCSVNVLQIADEICSGKSNCNVPVLNTKMIEKAHCLDDDLSAYLEAAYYCQKG